jgi:hypothetical protein
LTGDLLREQAAIAERLLELRGAGTTVFTGAEAADAARAVALQISLQMAADPESFIAFSVGRGAESIVYRRDIQTGSMAALHPIAVSIVDQLYAEIEGEAGAPEKPAWPIMGPWR